jgi:hypothetical protein
MSVGFQVLTAMRTKMAVFWVVGPCSLIALMMEAARISKTLVNFYQTTKHYSPKTIIFDLKIRLNTGINTA